MLNFVQNWLTPRANPIGIDFGTDCLRMAQVQSINGQPTLFAAASEPIPLNLRNDLPGRLDFLTRAAADLLSTKKFHGRSAVLALPAASTFIHHMTVTSTEEGELKAAIEQEAFRRFELGPETMFLRHVIADSTEDVQRHVMIFGARRSAIEQLLTALAHADLDVIGMNLEPQAQVDCFGHMYQRESETLSTTALVDIGAAGSRITITRDGRIQYAKSLGIGGDHLTAAIARAMNVSQSEAKLLRLKLAHSDAVDVVPDRDQPSIQLGDFTPAAVAAAEDIQRRRADVDTACSGAMGELIEQITAARREFEQTSGGCTLSRLVFVGGEAGDRRLCQQIARGVQLAAQIGDPLLQLGRNSDLPIESGIDRRKPQPAWCVAVGLSLGPVQRKAEPTQPPRRRVVQRTVGHC